MNNYTNLMNKIKLVITDDYILDLINHEYVYKTIKEYAEDEPTELEDYRLC